MVRKIAFALFFSAAALLAQDQPKKAPADQPGADSQIAGGLVRDDRLTIDNLTFWKKSSPDGKGDYLELTFEITNKTEDAIPLKMFLIGFNERDLVDKEYRRLVEYPKWRPFDEDKKLHKLILFDSIPALKPEEVSAFVRKKEEAIARNSGAKPREEADDNAGAKKKPTLRQFLQYVQFIHENPNTGIDVLLQGFENTNYNLKCSSEAKTGRKCLEKKGSYLIEEKALKANVWGKLLARYSLDKKFFNHVGLVLYDTEARKVVHRQFYRVRGRFKIY